MIGVPFAAPLPTEIDHRNGGRAPACWEICSPPMSKFLPSAMLCVKKAEHAQSLAVKAGQASPELYTDGDHAFESLVARDDLDLVIIATPWNWHVEMAVAAMTHGKHAPSKCPPPPPSTIAGNSSTHSERTRRHCMMLENCCLRLQRNAHSAHVHEGLVGDLLTEKAHTFTTFARSSSPPRAKACGARLSHAIERQSLPPHAWAGTRWPIT